jgi:hypothetical protein
MKYIIAAAIVAFGITLTPMAAAAGERVTNTVLGGVSGALVAGPVGLVAGGVIGYTAGKDIARGMGLKRDRRHSHHRRVARTTDRSSR